MDAGAGSVAQYLHFHVARFRDELLEVECGIAESGVGFTAGNGEILDQLRFAGQHAHASTTASRGRLEHHGEAGLLAGRPRVIEVIDLRVGAGNHRQPCRRHGLSGDELVSGERDVLRCGSDERQPLCLAGGGEPGVLGQEAVARMYCGCAAPTRRIQESVYTEIALDRRARADRDRLVGPGARGASRRRCRSEPPPTRFPSRAANA